MPGYMNILGLNVNHPSAAACLIQDGILTAAVMEEGFSKAKSFSGFPHQAIDYCLNSAGLSLSDITYIAVNYRPRGNKDGFRCFCKSDSPNFFTYLKRLWSEKNWPGVEDQFKAHYPKQFSRKKLIYVNHQLAHLSLSYYLSGFDAASVVNFDDMGDFASTSWGYGLGDQIHFEGQVHYPHSLGLFYRAFMQYLGIDPWSAEEKLLLLAEGGLPKYIDQIRKMITYRGDGAIELNLDYFDYHKRRDRFEWSDSEPHSESLFSPAVEESLGTKRSMMQRITKRHRDIAHSAVVVMEEIITSFLRDLYKKHGKPNLCLSGHIAHNFLTVEKLTHITPFEKIFVPPLANDAGSAIGAAQSVLMQFGGKRLAPPRSNGLGPAYLRDELLSVVSSYEDRLIEEGCSIERDNSIKAITQLTAIELSMGNAIGWFQGPLDFAPHSFGNRSILYDPRRDDYEAVLAQKIQYVDLFNSYSASILDHEVMNWFAADSGENLNLQYTRVFESKLQSIPFVAKSNGKTLIHTVSSESNELFYHLLKEFYKKTAVPLLLDIPMKMNNVVALSPADAVEIFLSTQIDLLVLGNIVIRRNRKRPVRLQIDGLDDINVLVR